MTERSVQVERRLSATADEVWSAVRDFAAAWHPAVDWMREERSAGGCRIRAFAAGGEDKIYREQLVWFSDSERSYEYLHLSGIDGVDQYTGRLTVTGGQDGGSNVEMSASFSASEDRADEIAGGTKAIFEMGVGSLAKALPPKTHVDPARQATSELTSLRIGGDPELAITATEKKGETLCLFLHGIGGGRSNWTAQLPIAARHFTATAMDLRGYGESALGAAQSTVDDYCDDVLRVMDALGASRLVLCGLSYGAWIATSFAMRRPDLLDGLILMGGCTGMSEAGLEEREAFRSSRETPLDAGAAPSDFAPAVIDIISGPNAGVDFKNELLASMSVIPAATYRDALRCFTNLPERFDFSRLSAPVLLMTGEHDALAPPAEIMGVSHRIKTAGENASVRYETIAGAGHVCNLEQPERCNRILEEFLISLAR